MHFRLDRVLKLLVDLIQSFSFSSRAVAASLCAPGGELTQTVKLKKCTLKFNFTIETADQFRFLNFLDLSTFLTEPSGRRAVCTGRRANSD